MEGKELTLNKDICNSGNDGFIDRSKVRILLCDNDSSSSEEVFRLLLGCSYQVTSVKSARQVIDALNAEGPEIDIILSEVDLPMAKGMKMLKYIARDKELRRIPIIMMSAQDEVSVVVKCLRLGAADYLVKPLRTNELLNLWTHMWRRRRMLGLVEKNIMNYDFDLMVSDPSDVNTNSTTLFSDDTDDMSRRCTDPETAMAIQQENESTVAVATGTGIELSQTHVSGYQQHNHVPGYQPDVPGISDRISDCRTELAGNLSSGSKKSELAGNLAFGPKKSELRIGESSAFFTYVKSPITISNSQRIGLTDDNSAQCRTMKDKKQGHSSEGVANLPLHENGEMWESYSREDLPSSYSIPESLSLERSCTPPTSTDQSLKRDSDGKGLHQEKLHQSGSRGPELDMSQLPPQHAYPYYMPGVNQVMMQSSAHLYPNNMQDLQNHAMIAQYNHHMAQCSPHTNGMTSFPYYPVGYCLQPGQLSANHSWPSFGNSSSSEAKPSKVDRREAALIKFRQKRKERCFDKKIRYVNRKHLAERRPRVRGQFVRKVNGVNVDLNGEPTSADFEEEDEDVEDGAGRESSPEDNI